MKVRIGLGLSNDAARGVMVRGDAVLWHGEERIEGDMDQAIRRLIARMPVRLRRRAVVQAAAGPSVCQVKRLDGLPSHTPATTISEAVRANTERFFLRNGVPIVTGEPERRNDAWWAAAFDLPTIEGLSRACDAEKLRLSWCAPTAVLLSRALIGERLLWRDGEVAAEAQITGEEWTMVRRVRVADDAAKSPPAMKRAMAPLGADAERYVDAYAAGASSAATSLAFKPRAAGRAVRRARYVRACLLGAVAMGVLAMLGAQGGAAWYGARQAAGSLTLLRDRATQVARANSNLQRAAAMEGEIARFTESRRSMTALLGQLSIALPDSTAIVSFRADTTSGMMVLLATAGANVLAAIDSVPGIEGAQIVGPLAREMAGTSTVQRLSVRFHFHHTGAPRKSPRALASTPPGAPQ